MTTTEVIVAVLLVINVMEAVRRVVSMSLFWVICFFLAYAWFGQYIPGLFRFSGISFPKLMEVLMYGENGIFGSPLVTSLGTLFYFLVFGTFFSNCGGGGVLIDGGMKLSDKTVGGPAKAAVISSGLLGMVSGSAIANVSTTGVLTIPLMKKTGYDPEEAAAVESVASTGGQIMPPIMGAGAFIMAEIIGVQYAQIAAAAVLPAVAYFLAVFILVHMIAKKKGLGKDSGVHYEGKPILPRVYRLLPIFYFGVVAQITPPVCLASFTAAGIAGASVWKTGWKAFSFAITAFIVPFAFVYRPAILLEGTMVEIIIAYCIVIAATYLLACGIAGYLFRPLKMWERIACYIVAFIFILPSSMSDIIGIAGCVLIMAYCFMTGKKNANKAQPA